MLGLKKIIYLISLPVYTEFTLSFWNFRNQWT